MRMQNGGGCEIGDLASGRAGLFLGGIGILRLVVDVVPTRR